MNEITSPIIFYPVSILLLLSVILALKFKNIFYSLLSAIIAFFLVGMLFYILGSEYNAVIQIAIYGVAVPIVLGLAVMFTDIKSLHKEKKLDLFKYLMVLFGGIFILAVVYLIMTSNVIMPNSFNLAENMNINSRSTLFSFGQGLYLNYVFAFELVSIILTIVVAGLTIFNNKEME